MGSYESMVEILLTLKTNEHTSLLSHNAYKNVTRHKILMSLDGSEAFIFVPIVIILKNRKYFIKTRR